MHRLPLGWGCPRLNELAYDHSVFIMAYEIVKLTSEKAPKLRLTLKKPLVSQR